jgi:hypothetical protein
MSQRNILSINGDIGDGQNVHHKFRLNVQGSHCHSDKMLQWTFWLGQNVTVDVVNFDVSSRHRGFLHTHERTKNPGSVYNVHCTVHSTEGGRGCVSNSGTLATNRQNQQAQNTMTTSLCWSHNTSSLVPYLAGQPSTPQHLDIYVWDIFYRCVQMSSSLSFLPCFLSKTLTCSYLVPGLGWRRRCGPSSEPAEDNYQLN